MNTENNSDYTKFRKLYPANDFYINLLTLANPRQINRYDNDNGYTFHATSSLNETGSKVSAILYFAKANGFSLKETVIQELVSLNVSFDEWEYHQILHEVAKYPYFEQLVDNEGITNALNNKNWNRTTFKWNGWKSYFDKLATKIIPKLSLAKPRNKLNKWIDEIEPGHALVVKAPMGLGKSHSIVHVLCKMPSLSAVIFLPTKKMCRDMAQKLRVGIAERLGKDDIYDRTQNSYIINCNSNNYLPNEVFFHEGINPEECLHFSKISDQYKNQWYSKKRFCQSCQKNISNSCRFINWQNRAMSARIIVTTHSQYDLFINNNKLHKYIDRIHGTTHKSRDLFLIDEDLIITNCYSPKNLTHNEVKRFTDILPQFLDNVANHNVRNTIIDKVDLLFGRINKPEITSIIPPIDTNFLFPESIKEQWIKSYSDLISYEPDYLEYRQNISPPNIIDIIEHGIRYGVVVQRYRKTNDSNKHRYVNNIFFPNPKSYDLTDCPTHVFFDGTPIDPNFFEYKMKGVSAKTFNPLESLSQFNHAIYQNTNTDLPATKIEKDKLKVLEFVKRIIDKHGRNSSYFIHSTKAIHDGYLASSVSEMYPQHRIFFGYYGNLRSENRGEDCDIHIMLGSYNTPDALEIAMGLEFVQESLNDKIMVSTRNNVWSFSGSVSQRKYTQGYEKIQKLAQLLRFSEQRQALARTRYISHKVTFYVLSKDRVSDYEPYLPEPVTLSFAEDLFPPRKLRRDHKYEEVKNTISTYLSKDQDNTQQERGKACDMDIVRQTGFHRATVKKHRQRLIEEGFIHMISKTYYTLSSPN